MDSPPLVHSIDKPLLVCRTAHFYAQVFAVRVRQRAHSQARHWNVSRLYRVTSGFTRFRSPHFFFFFSWMPLFICKALNVVTSSYAWACYFSETLLIIYCCFAPQTFRLSGELSNFSTCILRYNVLMKPAQYAFLFHESDTAYIFLLWQLCTSWDFEQLVVLLFVSFFLFTMVSNRFQLKTSGYGLREDVSTS